MPKFFFHLASRHKETRDEIGKELTGLGEAHEHALQLIRRVLFSLREEDTNGWMVHVATQEAGVLLTVLFPRRQTENRVRTRKPAFFRFGVNAD
jgi:Domain of unknown function (DUF6894)